LLATALFAGLIGAVPPVSSATIGISGSALIAGAEPADGDIALSGFISGTDLVLEGVDFTIVTPGCSGGPGSVSCALSNFTSVVIIGGDGDDVVTLSSISGPTFAIIVLGGGGNDVLFGSAGDDVMFGGAGDDILFGGDGIDLHSGGVPKWSRASSAPNTGLRKRRDDAVHHHGAIHSWSGVRVRRGASYVPALLYVNEPRRSDGAVAVRADGGVRPA
jgi:hypothetical protein